MGGNLEVTPSALTNVASEVSNMSSEIGGLRVGQTLTDAVGSVQGLQAGAAVKEMGSVFDKVSQQLGVQWSSFSDKLKDAATAYSKTDDEQAQNVKKAGDGIDDKSNNTSTTSDGKPTSKKAIGVGDVTYDKGNWASGSAATKQYINEALDKRGITDPAARARWTQAYMTLCEHESSYNPMAINLTDSNATGSTGTVSDGHGNKCSRGLAQCIPSTFAAYHQDGTSNNIYDPVANIAASMNYIQATYGVSSDASNIFAKVGQTNSGVHQGY